MEIIIAFLVVVSAAATLFAVLTNITLWIGCGLLALCLLFCLMYKYESKYDYAGDAALGYLLTLIAPSFIASIIFFIAGGIKYLVTHL